MINTCKVYQASLLSLHDNNLVDAVVFNTESYPQCNLSLAATIVFSGTSIMAEVIYRTNASRVADEERDVRVEDYLNDKLQNTTDLANIDSLLEDVKAQQVLLQQQVCSSTQSCSPMPPLTCLS